MIKNNLIKSMAFAMVATISFCSVQADQPSKSAETVNRFLESIEKNDAIKPETKKEVSSVVTELRDDEFSIDAAITEGLAMMYPKFADALELVGKGQSSKAFDVFKQLSTIDDKFLAAEAKYFIARAYVYDENYEDAIPVLSEFQKSFAQNSVQDGNALYLKGIAFANTLKNKESIEALTKFMNDYPNASERMRVGAWRQLQMISQIKKDTLGDVLQRMEFSRRRLSLERTDQNTKIEQDKVVKMLETMIKKAEDKEKKGNCNCDKPGEPKPGEGDGKKEGKGKSNNGQGSKNPDGFAKRTFGSGDASDWSKLRDRERDPAFNAIKEKFPARYKELVEKYYKSFQKSGTN